MFLMVSLIQTFKNYNNFKFFFFNKLIYIDLIYINAYFTFLTLIYF